MRLLLAIVALAALGGACSSEPRELVEIELLELENRRELTFIDSFDPFYAEGYPETVAEVNGRPIPGAELAMVQVNTDYEGSGVDPLESLIDQELLAQAGERLGHMPTSEQVFERTVAIERNTLHRGSEQERRYALDAAIARGWPIENWGESDVVLNAYERSMAITFTMTAECEPPDLGTTGRTNCTDFLAQERENAVIKYFVVWAE